MISQVINEITKSGSTLSLSELSRKLGIEESALEGMLDYCVKKGILRGSLNSLEAEDCVSTVGGCGSDCEGYQGCPMIARMPRTYELHNGDPEES